MFSSSQFLTFFIKNYVFIIVFLYDLFIHQSIFSRFLGGVKI